MVKSSAEKIDMTIKLLSAIPDDWSISDVASVAELFAAKVIFDMELEPDAERIMINVVSDNIRLLLEALHNVMGK